jgi:hypothetical protein
MKKTFITFLLFFFSTLTANAASLVTYPTFHVDVSDGNPLTGGCVYTYTCGTTTKLTTCADKDCNANNTNPIELDDRGEAGIYYGGCLKVSIYTADSDGICDSTPSTTLVKTVDNIYGSGYIPPSDGISLSETYDNDISAAIAAIGSTQATLICDDAVDIANGEIATFPGTLTFEARESCLIDTNSTGTININGPFTANLTQHFTGTGTIEIPQALKIYPQWFGAAGDGSSDDSLSFRQAQNVATARGGGVIIVPYTEDGYKIGDGTNVVNASTKNGIVVTSNTTWRGLNNVKLIHGAKTASGNFLFDIGDCDNVLIEGFDIDGQAEVMTDQARVGVALHDVATNIRLKDLHLYDHANFAIQYADIETDPDLAYFNNVSLDEIRIDGITGATGAGAGIDIFPRSQVGSDPKSTNFSIRNSIIDVSNGSTNCDDHGPQPFKLNNTDGADIANVKLVGGEVASLIISNGSRNVSIDADGRLSDLGLIIDTSSNVCDSRTQSILVKNWKYDSAGASNSNLVGIQIKGAVHNVSIASATLTDSHIFIRDNYANDISLGDGLGDTVKRLVFGDIEIKNGYFDVQDATNALQSDLVGLVIDTLHVSGSAGSSRGKLNLDPTDWEITDAHIGSVSFIRADNDCVKVGGSNNVFNYILSIDGNPDDDANGWVVNDTGNYNIFNFIGVTGSSSEMDLFYNKSVGSGAQINRVSGTPIDANGIRVAQMESADVILGGARVISKSFDLSGAADSEILFYADTTYYIASIVFLYAEASSADAGVAVQVGDTGSASAFLSKTSSTDKTLGNTDLYQNTTGTNSFSNRDLVKGQYLRVTSAGSKTGTGEVQVIINLIQSKE